MNIYTQFICPDCGGEVDGCLTKYLLVMGKCNNCHRKWLYAFSGSLPSFISCKDNKLARYIPCKDNLVCLRCKKPCPFLIVQRDRHYVCLECGWVIPEDRVSDYFEICPLCGEVADTYTPSFEMGNVWVCETGHVFIHSRLDNDIIYDII